MCTCIAYQNGSRIFGRNLDLEYSFQERVVFTPRRYAMHFLHMPDLKRHYALLGMAAGISDYPLYADACNEKGLSMAGLYFPENACYHRHDIKRKSIASFELIPWVLGQCSDVEQVIELLEETEITDESYSSDISPAPLHWMVTDLNKSIVIEPVQEGLRLYENPFEILTNNPPFPYHRERMREIMTLSSDYPVNRFSKQLDLQPYGEGMGAIGLPGDASPGSRFVRAAFYRFHSVTDGTRLSDLMQMFHLLEQTGVVKGSVLTKEGNYDLTRYYSCIDMKKRVYYYKTYHDFQIRAVDLCRENLESQTLKTYTIESAPQIFYQN